MNLRELFIKLYNETNPRVIVQKSGAYKTRIVYDQSEEIQSKQEETRKILENAIYNEGKIPISPYAFAYVKGRSREMAAMQHTNKDVVARLDINKFFESCTPSMFIRDIDRNVAVKNAIDVLGFELFLYNFVPDYVSMYKLNRKDVDLAKSISEINFKDGTHFVEEPDLNSITTDKLLDYALNKSKSLPYCLSDMVLVTGSTTAPILSNIVMYGADLEIAKRLNELASQGINIKDIAYTRYSDDIVVSFNFTDKQLRYRWGNIINAMHAITKVIYFELKKLGLTLKTEKLAVMPWNSRQYVLGYVVNRHLNLPREDKKRLRLVLDKIRKGTATDEEKHKFVKYVTWAKFRLVELMVGNPVKDGKIMTTDEIREALYNAVLSKKYNQLDPKERALVTTLIPFILPEDFKYFKGSAVIGMLEKYLEENKNGDDK